MKRTARWVGLLLLLAVVFLGCFLHKTGVGELSFSPGMMEPSAFASEKVYTGEDFGIESLTSPHDADGDGVDDYTDLLLGARADAEACPRYDPSYFAGGYPPEDRGVCTDLVWRAFRAAGYDLKSMVDRDIAAHVELYPRVGGTPDPNIDFRRVPNLRVFLERHAESLTLDPGEIAEWQPGDIVTFGDKHIGIISDRRDENGVPYLLHNDGSPDREDRGLLRWHRRTPISGHFRYSEPVSEPVF